MSPPRAAVWQEGILYFDTGATQQKAINLRSNPHVVLTTGCNHWDRGLDVVVEGEAVRVTDDDLLRHLAGVWATRWDGSFQFVADGGYFHHAQDRELPPVGQIDAVNWGNFRFGNKSGNVRWQQQGVDLRFCK